MQRFDSSRGLFDIVAELERRAPAKRDTAVRVRPVSLPKGERDDDTGDRRARHDPARDRRLDGTRPPSRRPGQPRRDGRLHRAMAVFIEPPEYPLRQLRPGVVSKRAGRGYLGYLRGQKERPRGTRGASARSTRYSPRSTTSSASSRARSSGRRFPTTPMMNAVNAFSSTRTGKPGAGDRGTRDPATCASPSNRG